MKLKKCAHFAFFQLPFDFNSVLYCLKLQHQVRRGGCGVGDDPDRQPTFHVDQHCGMRSVGCRRD